MAETHDKRTETHACDLIDRQAAVNAIKKLEKHAPTAQHLSAIFDCEDTIKAFPSAQQWIPVTERLPKEDGNYLVTFEEGYAEDYGFDSIGIAPFEVDCEGFGIWQEEFDRYTLGSLGSDWVEIKVIAWMPLPDSWKGEEYGTSRAVLSQKPVR